MKIRHRIQKSDTAVAETVAEGAKPTHRLTGITVNEVSIVDRAANQRKYLVVKHEDKVTKDVPPPQPTPPAPPAPPTAPTAPTLNISPELKAKVLGILQTAQERIGIISKVLEGSSETPGAPAPQELMDALTQLASLFAPAAAPPAPPHAAPPAPAAHPPVPAAKQATAKAGRKVSAARLAQLQSVQATLNALMTDVADEPETDDTDEGDKEPAKKNETTTPPAQPDLDPPSKDPKPPVEEPHKPAAQPDGQPVQPNPEVTEIKQSLEAVTDAIAKMTKVFEGQNARIEQLAKSRGTSRQLEDLSPVSKKSEPVRWDMDMAKPLKIVL